MTRNFIHAAIASCNISKKCSNCLNWRNINNCCYRNFPRGKCEKYRGLVCGNYLNDVSIFVDSFESQEEMENQIKQALTQICECFDFVALLLRAVIIRGSNQHYKKVSQTAVILLTLSHPITLITTSEFQKLQTIICSDEKVYLY